MHAATKLAKRFHQISPQIGNFKLPETINEPLLNYAPNSPERAKLEAALQKMKTKIKNNGPFKVPCIINGKEILPRSAIVQSQNFPHDHAQSLCSYVDAEETEVKIAIETALKAKPAWEKMPFNDRAAIFLKAADLLAGKYRYDMLAATMLGQGKNVWQAEIDSAAELADFWRFNCKYAADIYNIQPDANNPTNWNRLEYRALEGFVVAFSPFNFTAIGGNLAGAPALMGNVVLWKPSPMAMYSNYLIMKIFKEAGLPDGVIQFIPGNAPVITDLTFNHPEFAGLHFTGSTAVFKYLWKKISNNLNIYKSYPRIVGETGGKNFHFLHKSADVRTAVFSTIRGAFEYQGQKCSATSRIYVPSSMWPEFSSLLRSEVLKIKQGPVDDFTNFMGAVINKFSFDKITAFLDLVKNDKKTEILVGGGSNEKKGYFIEPTVLVTKDPISPTMTEELFGPVVTCFVYPDEQYIETLETASKTTNYALTGSLFAQERQAIITGSNLLRNSAGNFYINDKSTGAIVGQQPFGGGRGSGTNDKAGSALNLLRWVSPRTIKETFVPVDEFLYPSNLPSK